MDDCYLQKLTVKPGKLSPAFNREVTEYHVTVGSEVEKISFDCVTSDTGACYCISGGDRTVALKEGQVNDIKIEVSAEDGTIKNYWVYVRRLSAKDAALSDLKLSHGALDPDFNAEVFEYYCVLPCDVSGVTVTPLATDVKTSITVNGVKPGSTTSLNVGSTLVEIHVTSPDGSNTQTYAIEMMRKQIPRFIRITNPDVAIQYEDPVSLSPLYQPITIKGSEPVHTFSGPIISELTKTSKVDPLNDVPLAGDWKIQDYEMDKKISQVKAFIPLTDGDNSETLDLGELGTQLKNCHRSPQLEEASAKFDTDVPLKHTFQTRSWEKHMQQIFDETNPTNLLKMADNHLETYIASLGTHGRVVHYEQGESPLDHLQQATYCLATAIKNKSKDPQLHLRLGMVLEESYYAEDSIGLKKEKGKALSSMNVQAQESSKMEECAAICQLRGVSGSAPLSLQLKAIDEEYHHLVDSGQSGKADHVQKLYAWKSKQATQEGAAAQKIEDEESPLGQAYLKYLDALSLDDTKAIYHFHLGRMLVVQGSYEDAVPRLQAAIAWNAQHQMAKFYLGLALSLKSGGPASRVTEAIGYLLDGMEALLQANTEQALSSGDDRRKSLCAEDLVRSSNVHFLRGIVQLGKLLVKNDVKKTMLARDVFHTAALSAAQVLPTIVRGDTYQQVEWVLLEAHSQLLELLLANQKQDTKLIVQRCERLSAIIKNSTIPQNSQLLQLQEKTCQMLVGIEPCNSRALYLLGNAQLTEYDNNPDSSQAAQLLEESMKSFQASIAMEGKSTVGEPPADVTDQAWWKVKVKQEEEKKKAEAASKAPPPGSTGTRGGAAGARGGAARGGVAAKRGSPAPARGGAAAPRGAKGTPPAARGQSSGAAARGGAAAGRGTARGGAASKAAAVTKSPSGRGTPAAGTKPAGRPASGKSGTQLSTRPASGKSQSKHSCTAVDRPPSATKPSPPDGPCEKTSNDKGAINKKAYHARLGLARALAKNPDTISESQKYYSQVIDMAPQLLNKDSNVFIIFGKLEENGKVLDSFCYPPFDTVHDAYIESAEMLTIKDPLSAVDIYCKFPVSESPTFDDAYIFGEIVRLLIKAEKYDDPRLGPNMISMGKVMGIGVLEKYVKILDDKFKSELLKSVYAGVNGKSVDDPDMQAFFKFKCWI